MRKRLAGPLEFNASKADANALRMQFEQVAEEMIELAEIFGHTRADMLVEAYCPMAFKNTGAAWLQSGQTVDNPYFGHAMKRCGSVRRKFLPVVDTTKGGEK
jgi:Cu(I)/Ag(I) efflux system membrane fusion protein